MVGRVILAALLAAGLAAAQRGGGGGASKESRAEGGSMPRPQQQSKLDQIADKLKLNKEQKEQLVNILNAAAETAGPLNQQIMSGRLAITQAMVNGKDSGDDYTKLVGTYTTVLAQMDGVEATAYGKIYALLKPNQQKNAEQVFTESMAGMFVKTGGGGRRTRQ